MMNSLANLFKHQKSKQLDVERKYPSNVGLIKELLGFVPETLGHMNNWEPGLISYFLLVPNFLDLPGSLLKTKTKKLMGISMYEASKTAGCNYCTQHSCTFAQRRGAEGEIFEKNNYNAEQLAAKELASVIVNGVKNRHHLPLNVNDFSSVASASIMMGFLNKVMRTLNPNLEAELQNPKILQETDSIRTAFKVMQFAPGAIAQERQWLSDMPKGIDGRDYLKIHSGHEYREIEILKPKQLRALRQIIVLNTDKTKSEIGMKAKLLTGLLLGRIKGDYQLVNIAKTHLKYYGELINTDEKLIEKIADCQECERVKEHLRASLMKKEEQAALFLTWASESTDNMNSSAIGFVWEAMTEAQIIEIIVWNAVQELLHRLNNYQDYIKNLN